MGKKKTKETKTTPKAKGAKLVRNGNKFTYSWSLPTGKFGEKTEFKWKIRTNKTNKWPKNFTSLGANKTARSETVALANYYPGNPKSKTTIKSISFTVRGKAKKVETKKKITTYKMSKTVTKTISFKIPPKPGVSVERNSAYVTTITVTPNKFDSSNVYWTTKIEYQFAMQYKQAGKQITDKKWSTSYWKDAESSVSIVINDGDESSTINNYESVVRWIRVRACGPRGCDKNGWVERCFTYTAPGAPKNLKPVITTDSSKRQISCDLRFTFDHTREFFVDYIKIQYAFSEINLDLTPQNPSWEEAPIGGPDNIFKPDTTSPNGVLASETNQVGSVRFLINQDIPDNQLMFVRAVAYNNGKENPSEAVLCKDSKGNIPNRMSLLSKPTISGIDPPDGNKVQIHITNNCVVYSSTSTPQYEEVDTPVTENISLYYEKEYVLVAHPVVSELNQYYEYDSVTNRYFETEDESIVSGKKYYKFSGKYLKTKDGKVQEPYMRVDRPTLTDLLAGKYYEWDADDQEYVETSDEELEPGKIYYLYSKKDYYILLGNVVDSVYIALEFIAKDSSYQYNEKIIGVIKTDPPEQSQDYDFTLEIPPGYSSDFKIGAYAFIGNCVLDSKIPPDYDKKSPPVQGFRTYTITNLVARSERESYGGSVPQPPSNVEALHLGDGNVMVSWDWKWEAADAAEIAWSDYDRALESVEQPSTYSVTNQKQSSVIVRNLEMGKSWYFWVRLVKGENVSVWSNITSTSLASSPNVPTLHLSKNYITMDETITASWAYVSVDGSAQKSARICLCTIVSGVTVYGEIIAQVDGEIQYVVIDPNDEKLNWSAGNIYRLALKVTSEAGLESDDWSAVELLNIVTPLENDILSTSLVVDSDISYPEVYSSSSTYSSGDYVLKPSVDSENPSEKEMLLYKCTTAIDTPEEWNDSHWTVDDDHRCLKLTTLPLTIVGSFDGVDLRSSLKIERAIEFFAERPDENEYGGYEGEVIYEESSDEDISQIFSSVSDPSEYNMSDLYEYDSTNNVYVKTEDTEPVSGKTYYIPTGKTISYSVDQGELTGYLDDNAEYYLTYRTDDVYGQYSETKYRFVVDWDHQAIMPSADVIIENVVFDDYSIDIAKITINNPDPSYVVEGDSCDIYRISADGYTLIYEDAAFGQTYVDPYPTIGEHGGHRIVYKTLYGDYIVGNDEKHPAILDFRSDETDDFIYSDGDLIDFDDESLSIKFNLDISNTWSKDFQQTKYLGGSIQGDWNVGTSMTTSISANVLTSDWTTISQLRSLAQYEGICHIRTRDGMNYLADIQVSERIPYDAYYDPDGDVTQLGEYSLNITKVDPVELDGMTLNEWNDSISIGEVAP